MCGSRNVSTRLWTHASPSSWQGGVGAATAPDPRPWQGPRRQVVHAFWSRGHPVVRAFRRFPYTAQRVLGRFPYTTLRERTRPSGVLDGLRTRRPGSVHGPAGLGTVSVRDQARRGRPDFVHWRPCSNGGLRTGRRLYCTNPCRNRPSSAQSPCRRFRAPHAAGSRLAGCSPTQSAEEPQKGYSLG